MKSGKKYYAVLEAPIERWDEAVPLGNGLIGALLWGNKSNIKISLDRGDLWDTRAAENTGSKDFNWPTLKKWVNDKNIEKIRKFYNKSQAKAYPTKIPAGRIELDFNKNNKVRIFSLDLKSAIMKAEFERGCLEGFISAQSNIGVFRINGAHADIRLCPVPFGAKTKKNNPEDISRLGYPPPEIGKSGSMQWIVQKCTQGFSFAIVVGQIKRSQDITEIVFTIVTSNDCNDPLEAGIKQADEALRAGFSEIYKSHKKWWNQFWSKSDVSLPNLDLQKHYYFVQYLYGAGSKPGFPAMPLQGLWTADEGTLPPWKGDYHNDVNTQMTYWAYHTANRLEQGRCFIDFLWRLFDKAKNFANDFYGTKGACFPGVMTIDGQALTAWPQYSLSPTNSAWLAHNFYLHWRYTMDKDFLVTRAYPFCREIAQCLYEILKPYKNGFLRLPLSSSPEIHDDQLKAWLKPNSNYDLSLMKWLFGAVEEMAKELNYHTDAEWCRMICAKLEDLAVEAESFDGSARPGSLKLSQEESLLVSHRHLSHLMAVYPLGILHIEGTKTDRSIIEASIRHLDMLGYGLWVGFSFTWMACLSARCGMPELAIKMLELFLKAFISRNGFNLNGDYKKLGISSWNYRPFTLEANFAAAQAVHEMLLQSWNNVVRIFPAVPLDWKTVSFKNLRAEGAFLISASRKGGHTKSVRILAEKGGLLRLRNPFGDAKVKWSLKKVKRSGEDYICALKPIEVLEGETADV